MNGGAETGQPAGSTRPKGRNAGRPPAPAETAAPVAGGVLRARLIAAAVQPLAGGHSVPLPPPLPPSLERGVALASARAAARASGLPATAEKVTPSGITLAEVIELLPDGALIAIVEGAAERLGVVALCPAMIASLIEMQAMGRISSRPAGARRATRTDAAIAAEFVNALMAEAGTGLAAHPLGEALAGFRYASYLDDPRPLGLMLEDGGFHALQITLRLGTGGERTGHIFLAVPGRTATLAPAQTGAPLRPAFPRAPAADPPPGPAPLVPVPPRPNLAGAMAHAPVALTAILCRKSVTLRELRVLRPGATISLPRDVLEAVRIETAAGQPLASGRLGEADGLYAVRLSAPATADAAPPAGMGTGFDLSPGAANLSPDGIVAGGLFGLDPAPATDIPDFAAFATAFEPPIADFGAPDTFRTDAAPITDDDSVQALPMSFIIS